MYCSVFIEAKAAEQLREFECIIKNVSCNTGKMIGFNRKMRTFEGNFLIIKLL